MDTLISHDLMRVMQGYEYIINTVSWDPPVEVYELNFNTRYVIPDEIMTTSYIYRMNRKGYYVLRLERWGGKNFVATVRPFWEE